ncbi:cytochrome c oxidase subunit 4 [Actinotalea sp.]|uniref:cytochrome c oxidase subunit 4 n=1 Tax=Actinotalea sp. TaxID=1872145 RepID=UPI003567BE3A
MKVTVVMLTVLAGFFALVGTVYGIWSHGEAVGLGALLLCAGLAGMIAFYLAIAGRRSGPIPEDNPYAEVADGAGEQGTFAPWSWWPLVLALGCALSFAALAIGWWFLVLGAAVGIVGLIGWVFEYSRGIHAH